MRVFAAVAFASAVTFAPVLAVAQGASAPPAPAPATASTNNSGGNLDEVICKNSPPPTGSRLGGGRECHTQREWNQRQIDSQNALIQNQKMGYLGKGG